MPENQQLPTVRIDEAEILFRNFAGAEQPFNKAGDRNFCLLLPEELANQMVTDGWNVKTLVAKEEGDVDRPYVQVAVKYGIKPPRIVVIAGDVRTDITEDMVAMLDYAEIEKVDLIITPYAWRIEASNTSGIKAYLKTMFVTIYQDELVQKYNANGIG